MQYIVERVNQVPTTKTMKREVSAVIAVWQWRVLLEKGRPVIAAEDTNEQLSLAT